MHIFLKNEKTKDNDERKVRILWFALFIVSLQANKEDMKDYLYYLFDESLSGDELSAVKEQLCTEGAKVIDIHPTKKDINKRLKELKGPKQYALVIGHTSEAQKAAKDAKVAFCGWLDGTTTEEAFKVLPYRKLLRDIKLLPLLSQPYPYQEIGKPGEYIRKYTRWVHFKQIRGVSHKPKHNIEEHVCKNCGETYKGNFCPTCGQTYKVRRFDMTDLLKNVLSEAINIEHGFMRNFIELFWRPGYMMRDYLAGKRKDYHKPFQTIFVLATIYLVAAHLLDPASFAKEKEEPKLEQIPGIVQKMASDSTNTEIVPQLYEINKLASELIAKRREQATSEALLKADSILKLQHSSAFMSKEDSILIMKQVMTAMGKADSLKLSEVLKENIKDVKGIVGFFTRLSVKNIEVFEKFEEKYYHEGTFLYSMVKMLKDFFDMNRAVAIILMIPALVFCARRSFRTTLVSMRTNLAEYIFLFTFLGSQLLWLQLFTLISSQVVDFSNSFSTGAGFLFITWDLKQFFNESWKNAFKRTILYMGGYALLLAILIVPMMSILGSVFMWVLYQIT